MLAAVFLEARGSEYLWAGAKDSQALKRLLSQPLAEIERRWRIGLSSQGWRETATVAQLASKWNDLATPPKGPAVSPLGPQPSSAHDSHLAEATAACAPWAKLAKRLQARLQPDRFRDWMEPLRASVVENDLVLEAPNAAFASGLRDRYDALLAEEAQALQVAARVRIEVEGEQRRAAP